MVLTRPRWLEWVWPGWNTASKLLVLAAAYEGVSHIEKTGADSVQVDLFPLSVDWKDTKWPDIGPAVWAWRRKYFAKLKQFFPGYDFWMAEDEGDLTLMLFVRKRVGVHQGWPG